MARVLVVEDDPGTRATVAAWLQWMGHQVASADSVADALRLIPRISVDPAEAAEVAVLDIVMPDGSGIDVLQQLRQQPATSQIPAIFLSASKAESDRVATRNLGGHFVTKPVSRSVLQAAVESALVRYH